MGLDIYVGPLTRYYAGDWKTIVQQAVDQGGFQVEVVRSNPPAADALTDPHELRPAVLSWRLTLQRAAEGLPTLVWEESAEAEYWTDKPDWDGYWAVYFLAARDEFPQVRAPDRIPAPSQLPDPSKEPLHRKVEQAYRGTPSRGGLVGRLSARTSSGGPGHIPRYPHLLLPELWLPVDFERPFGAQDVAGSPMMIGSVPRLHQELELLNLRTLGGDAAALRRWREDGVPQGDDSLDAVARFGMTIFLEAARVAEARELPMKLDY